MGNPPSVLSRWSRRGRFLAMGAFAGAAFLLAPGGLLPEASARPQRARADMEPGSADGGQASGRMEVRRDRRGDKVRLTMNNLEPRTQYDVRDASTRDRLGGFRTNRSGRGRARLKDGSLAGMNLVICQPGSDEPVLEGLVPGEDEFNGILDGWSFRTGTLSTDWESPVQASLSLNSFGDPASEEGTCDSIDLWVSGTGVSGPVTLWIADGEGVLRQAAGVDAFDWNQPLPGIGDGNGAGGDPTNGGSRKSFKARGGRGHRAHKDRNADGSSGGGTGDPWGGLGDGGDWSGGWTGPDSFFSWYADNSGIEGVPGLPFGVASASDLSGRAVEVRDGEGNVLLAGEVPALEEVTFDLPPIPDPSDWGGVDFNFDFTFTMDWGTEDGEMPSDLANFLDGLLGSGWRDW